MSVPPDGSTAPDEGLIPDVTPELPGAAWRAALSLMSRLPQASLSRAFGRVADVQVPPHMRRLVLGGFARAMGIDTREAELPLEQYRSLNEFFVRRLRHGARTWRIDESTLVSPVDGIIGQSGMIREGRVIQAKGRFYSAAALVDDVKEGDRYRNGSFITIYLSPRHYHRIHSPCSGSIPHARHIPGALLPVNRAAVLHVPELFPRNERISCAIDWKGGRVAVVAVGAYNVGRISTSFDDDWAGPGASVTNRSDAVAASRVYTPPLPTSQGAELMAFHLGSTVVLLMEPGLRLLVPPAGSDVTLGQVLAQT